MDMPQALIRIIYEHAAGWSSDTEDTEDTDGRPRRCAGAFAAPKGSALRADHARKGQAVERSSGLLVAWSL